MPIKSRLILLLLLGCFAFQVTAQEAWTLERCIQYAYDNNIRLKQQELNVSNAENNLLQSKIGLLPNINSSVSYNSSKGKVLDQNTFTIVDGQTVNSMSGSIGGNVSLFNGLQKKNTIDRNEFSLLASIQNVEKLKNDLSLNIALYYLQIIHAEEQLNVAKNQLELTNTQVQRTKAMVEAGSVPEGELLDIESQAAREELQIVTANNTLELAKLDLAQLLDLETSRNFEIVVPDFSHIGIEELGDSVDDIFSTAESALPQVKSAEYELKSAEKSVSISKGSRSPSLSLSGGYSTRYSSSANMFDPATMQELTYPFWDQVKDGVNSYVGLSLSIPIFNGWQVNTAIKNAKLNQQNAQYQLQLTKTTLYKEIQQAYTDAVASLKKYMASAKAVTSLEEAFRYTEKKYEVGMMTFIDYSTAKTRLTAAQSDLLQAKFEYIFKIKVLDFYNGRPITL